MNLVVLTYPIDSYQRAHPFWRRVLKDTAIRERLRLQFRAEIFNFLNRANFNTPNLIIATLSPGTITPQPNPVAGRRTSTSTNSRQVQFALKLLW